jgi:hypothetical protein
MVEAEMTSHHGRLYALALALVVFFLSWAVVAAHPWATTAPDPRLRALAVREAQLRHEAKLVGKVVTKRWATYRQRLRERRAEIKRVVAANAAAAAAQQAAAATAAAPAASGAPAVRVVNLPAQVITRTS